METQIEGKCDAFLFNKAVYLSADAEIAYPSEIRQTLAFYYASS